MDQDDRSELNFGTIDFIASQEYMNRPPMPPVYAFVLDVSKPAILSGYLQYALHTIKSVFESGTMPDRTKVCFVTFDSSVHFYSLRATAKQP